MFSYPSFIRFDYRGQLVILVTIISFILISLMANFPSLAILGLMLIALFGLWQVISSLISVFSWQTSLRKIYLKALVFFFLLTFICANLDYYHPIRELYFEFIGGIFAIGLGIFYLSITIKEYNRVKNAPRSFWDL